MKITVIAVSAPVLQKLSVYEKRYREKYPDESLEFAFYYVAGGALGYLSKKDKMLADLRDSDMDILDMMGAPQQVVEMVSSAMEGYKGQCLVIGNLCREYTHLGAFSMSAMSSMMKKKGTKTERIDKKPGKKTKTAIEKMHRIRRMALLIGKVLPFGMMADMKNTFILIDYWQQASDRDIDSFMSLILRNYFGKTFLPKEKPCTMRYGIYARDLLTDETFDSPSEYFKGRSSFDPARDTVALAFYGHSYPNDFMPLVKAFSDRLSQSFNVLPVAFSQNDDTDLATMEKFFTDKDYPLSGIVNFMAFRLGAGPMGGDADTAVEILKKADVPYYKPFAQTKMTKEEWDRAQAVTPGEFLISIMLPELDGGLLTVSAGAMKSGDDKGDGFGSVVIEPDPERIDLVCRRLEKHLALRRKKNSEKRLVLVCYNYPPGEADLFGGAFLDTFASVSELLRYLKEDGYDVPEMSAEELRKSFVEGGICNSPQYTDAGSGMEVFEKDGKIYPVHGIRLGNIFIALQPARESGAEDSSAAYHDRNSAPREEYTAFYEWLTESERPDAVIHFGTHGTLEFLPGRENGMTSQCWPDRLIGDIPHFYYYYIGNPSEAVIAKRRTQATLVSYQGPPLKEGGLYGDLSELRQTISEYRESRNTAPERSEDLFSHIEELGRNTGLLESGDLTESGMDVLEEKLYQYEHSLITDGLHVMDRTEYEGLSRALSGRYLPVSPAGDPYRDPDILPAGRNLVQFDPRLVPTPVAVKRGAEAAEKTIELYRKENGRDPEKLALIVWGLETSKTQGESIGQIMYCLGARLIREGQSFENRLELIPDGELDRPRTDVTIHICGFFRDMYPNLLDDLNELFKKLRELPDGKYPNWYRIHSDRYEKELLEAGYSAQEARELAGCRIFGPKRGEYGTRLTRTVREGRWQDASELGTFFTEDLSYAYTGSMTGTEASDALAGNYRDVDLISQVRNNAEYEMVDLDHYYEFYGGLARAVENVTGGKPLMLVADTTGDEVTAGTLADSLNKGIRTRLLNPAWIDSMMRHEYHGAEQIQKRFENVMGFAASTDQIEGRVFSDLEDVYVHDAARKEQMQKSNRWAYLKMLERLTEAYNRGYWNASDDELNEIREAYLETEGEAET